VARYLITGIAGFVGAALAHHLVSRGHEVRGIDNLSAGTEENLKPIRQLLDFRLADLQDQQSLLEACDGVEVVLHQAAIASVQKSITDPRTSHDANLTGTLNLLIAANQKNVKRIVYASSCAVYGGREEGRLSEHLCPRPTSPYGVNKAAAELYIQSFCRNHAMSAICLRYFNLYGPRQSADSPYSGVVSQFITKMLRNQDPVVYGDGSARRDFVHVDDAVRANVLASSADHSIADGRVFNVGTGRTHSIHEVYTAVADIVGHCREPVYVAPVAGDIRKSCADPDRSRRELAFVCSVGLREGLMETVKWYKQQCD
jgi:nucleoside-diphosphate-sugar epimerase